MNEGFHVQDGYLGAFSIFLGFASIALLAAVAFFFGLCMQRADEAHKEQTRAVRRRKWR